MLPTFVILLSYMCHESDFASVDYNINNVEVVCQCVPQHMCQDNDATINGEGLLDIRYEKSVCKNYFEVCCENPVEDLPSDTSHKPLFKGCGYQHSIGVGYRITGESTNANFGELPWSVVILYKDADTDRNIYKCGGSLIHHQVVLTAAHCMDTAINTQWTIRAGEWNTRTQEEPLPHQDRTVQEVAVHPQYHSGSLKNDIALLFLSEPVELAGNVGFICLPPSEINLDNARCIASGWGKDAFKKGRHSPILKKVELPIVPRDLCLKSLRTTRLGKFYHLHRSFICAGGEQNKDTCKGDGGSPLVCSIPGKRSRFVQAGIVSWGIGCGENNTPGVYVNVALYRDWIDKQLDARSFGSNLYKYEE